jgi:hypothetical protein
MFAKGNNIENSLWQKGVADGISAADIPALTPLYEKC